MRLRMLWSGLTVRSILGLYLFVDLALLLREGLSHPGAPAQGQQAFWICVDVFLVYRITRGSPWAWVVALLLTALTIPFVVFAAILTPLVAALLASSLLQLALLLHPAIRRRVGIGHQPTLVTSED
jgi:hypothetical protein